MTHKIITSETNSFPAFEINQAKDSDWKNLIKKKGFYQLNFIPGLWWLTKHFGLFLLFLGGIFLNSCITTLVQDRIKQPTQDVRLDKSQFEQSLQALTPQIPQKP